MLKLLVVEDNVSLLESIKQILSDEYEVDTADNGDDGLFMALQNIYDAIVLDVMLPGMDGFEIVKQMRAEKNETSVLFLTAKDGLEDRVRGLEMGGDDYLVKPFQAPELKARIQLCSGEVDCCRSKRTLRIEVLNCKVKKKILL